MNCKLRFTKWLLLLLLGCAISASADELYSFGCDINGVALPGFFVGGTNIVGVIPDTALSNDVVRLSLLNTTSNNIVTNSAAQFAAMTTNVNSFSNGYVAFQGSLVGITALPNGSVMLGGTNNISSGTPTGSAWIGGISNRIDGGFQSGILGGQFNWLDQGNNASWIVGGFGNHVYGAGNVVLGGQNNRIGINSGPQNDSFNTIFGGTNNQAGGHYSVMGGNSAYTVYDYDFIWADNQGGTNFQGTANNQVLFRASGGFGIGTNAPGTNQLAVAGNSDFQSLSIQGTNILGQFTALSQAFQFNLTSWSNSFAISNGNTYAYANAASNSLSASNALTLAYAVSASNNVQAFCTGLSNYVQSVSNLVSGLTSSKAFSAALPATYGSIGIGFSTPLMPDGNFSVELTPADQNTAWAITQGGMVVSVGSKNSSGYTITAAYATNAFDLHFDCIIKENTQ